MNFVKFIDRSKQITTSVFTSHHSHPSIIFNATNAKIYRQGIIRKSLLSSSRYLQYFKFYTFTFFKLIFLRPPVILYYETLSVLPVYLYACIYPSVRVYIHYHEYTSGEEIENGSALMKWLHKIELKLYAKAAWISHTNYQRIDLFRQDNSNIYFKNLQILPNYPPLEWYALSQKHKGLGRTIKFVYVGALSLVTMYTKDFALWVKSMNGAVIWDIYSGNYSKEVKPFFDSLACEYISFKEEVDYYALPGILCGYDVGVIIYNGHIPNYIYNVPNKLFEYHSCGLDVWFSDDLEGSFHLITQTTYPSILNIDFKNLESVSLEKLVDRHGKTKLVLERHCNQAFEPLINSFLDV
jgi:hypothetical protein